MFTVYRTTNTINSRYYIGVHKTNNPHDSYMGSGLAIKRAIAAHGSHNFTKEILYTCDTREESCDKERELISECINDPLCYNISYGGDGGWDYYNNKIRPQRLNPMKSRNVVEKNLQSRRKNETPESIEKKSSVGLINIRKAIDYNTGRKRPKQSLIMQEKSSFIDMWKDKEQMRDRLSTCFSVVSPFGDIYKTNRLEEFCELRNITYVSVWNTSRTNKPVKKGRAKGWKCTIIHD